MKKSVRKTRSTAPTRRKKRTVARREPSLKPERITAKLLTESRKNKKKKTDGSGPLEWLLPMFESAYTPLEPKGTTSRAIATATASSFDIAATATLAAAAPTMWRDILLKYKQRKVAAAPAMALGAARPLRPGRTQLAAAWPERRHGWPDRWQPVRCRTRFADCGRARRSDRVRGHRDRWRVSIG